MPIPFLSRLFCLIFFKCSLVFGQHGSYVLDTLYPVHTLDHILKVYSDPNGDLTPEKLLADTTLTFLKGDELPRYLEVGTMYWGKLSLKAKQPLEGWTLHFEDKMIGPPAWTKSNGRVDVYAYSNNELLFHQKTGSEYAEQLRSYKGHWAMNAIHLDQLPTGTPVTLVMRVQGNALGYPSYFNLTARSPEQPFYHQFNQYHSSFNLFLLGVTFIILVYHLLQYMYLREKIYAWFCLWLLFCTITQAMAVGLVVGNLATYKYATWFVLANGQFFSFWLFGRAFIDAGSRFPKLHKVMLGLALFILIEILAMMLYILVERPKTYFTGVSFHYTILNIYAILSFAVSLVLILKKDLFARYFGVGAMVGSLSLLVGTLWSMGMIRPPFGLDPFSTGIFLQIILYSFGIAYRRQTLAKHSEAEKLEAERSRLEMLRMKDLDDLKTRFFTNISHEFRTPLTLIKGPIENAKRLHRGTDGEGIILNSKDFERVERNANRLQVLVDELMELSKLESGKTLLSLSKKDIVAYLKLPILCFESMAESSGIAYNITFNKTSHIGYFDAAKLEKIINNLLSNAFKYTQEGGQVSANVVITGQVLELIVSDSGKGIAQDDLSHVFDRFYQVEGNESKGSGIGLALTKELVDLHNGNILVESTLGRGTTFRVKLPITLEGLPSTAILLENDGSIPTKIGITDEESEEYPISMAQKEQALVLVVEDNIDIRNFIDSILRDKYRVALARNGEEAEAIALERIPDIVVSDVMMPKKDGFALCHGLKTNTKTSHIPIILLTAKAGQDNKMQGLYTGADAYLTKPFNADELIVRIRNLIAVREKLWQKVKDTDGVLIESLSINSIDDEFIKKVFTIIREHLDDSSFTVEALSLAVGFSRAQLHRKLKALLNKSPNQLITEIRLNSAYMLLKHKSGNVSEVAYSVGYSNLSYFAKSFKQKFGISPSEIIFPD